jgi:hypothetical protein
MDMTGSEVRTLVLRSIQFGRPKFSVFNTCFRVWFQKVEA